MVRCFDYFGYSHWGLFRLQLFVCPDWFADESGIVEGYKLPCDVRLPPDTTIKKGCDLETLLVALRARDGKNVSFGT